MTLTPFRLILQINDPQCVSGIAERVADTVPSGSLGADTVREPQAGVSGEKRGQATGCQSPFFADTSPRNEGGCYSPCGEIRQNRPCLQGRPHA